MGKDVLRALKWCVFSNFEGKHFSCVCFSWWFRVVDSFFDLSCFNNAESIATKNPKERTSLLEQIFGSGELKREYEKCEEDKARAEEQSALSYQKKRTIVMERKQKKEQKEEAEKHLHLQNQL